MAQTSGPQKVRRAKREVSEAAAILLKHAMVVSSASESWVLRDTLDHAISYASALDRLSRVRK